MPAHWPDMNVRSGSLAGDRGSKREVRNVIGREKLPQPNAFRLIGIDRHIDAVAVVETQGTVHRRFPVRAHRNALGKSALKCPADLGEVRRCKAAITLVALAETLRFGRG